MLQERNITIAIMILAVAVSLDIILPCCALSTQEATELEFILSHNPIDTSSKPSSSRAQPRTYNLGIKTLLVGAIRFYQVYISTQDMPACNFTPSCSRFGVESIRILGAIRGILLTSDRLQRCNGMSASRYETDYRSGLLSDPTQFYRDILE